MMVTLRPECAAHRATLYNYLSKNVLPMLKDDGVWMAPDPAPLNADEVAIILESIAGLDVYARQNLATRTDDRQMVTLYNGVVTVEPEPHDCSANAQPCTTDGPLGHGWECGVCGKFLQAG